MDVGLDKHFINLTANLEGLISLYRALFDVLVKERSYLLAADTEALVQNNSDKELLLQEIKHQNFEREKIVFSYAENLDLITENPRLLEIAQKLSAEKSITLKKIHSQLEKLITTIVDFNKDNEVYAQSALKTVSGAINNIKETLGGKKTYEKKGLYKAGPEQSGHFVSKEV